MALQIGFIGAGSAAWRHSGILRDIAEVQITAFCDSNGAKSSAIAAKFGAQAFTSAERMFRALKFDAIYICLPTTAHGAPENLAIKNGCAVFIEPPIAAHIRTATTISNAIRRNGTLVCVGSAWRYSESLERAKKLLRLRRSESSGLISSLWQSELSADATDDTDALWLEAWPLFDQLRYLTGEPKRLIGLGESAQSKSQNSNSGRNKSGLLAETKSGTIANLSASRTLNKRGDSKSPSFNENSQIRILRAGEEIELHFSRGISSDSAQSLRFRSGSETLQVDTGQSLDRLQNLAFLRAVSEGKRTEIRCNYTEAIKTLKFALAAQRAMGSAKFLEL